MDDQERKLKRQQALEEYNQIVSYEIEPVAATDNASPGRRHKPEKKRKHIFLRFFLPVLIIAGMAVCYFYIGNRISLIARENKQLKEELADADGSNAPGAPLPQDESEATGADNTTQQAVQPDETLENAAESSMAAEEGDSTEEANETAASQDAAQETEEFTAIYPLRGSSTILHSFGPYTDEDGEDAVCYGLALSTDSDTDVVAAAGGTVIYADDNPTTGLTVQVDHQNGYITEYTGNKQLLVSTGQAVAVGQPIAITGSADGEDAGHMEFRVLYEGSFINPEEVLKIVG